MAQGTFCTLEIESLVLYILNRQAFKHITGHILEKENLFTQSDVNMQDTFQIKVKQKLRFQV